MDTLEFVHAKTKAAYNLVADRYHRLFHNEMKEKEYDRNLLDDFAGRLAENAVVCDAGCGPSAHIGRYFFDKGIQVVGLDISGKCIGMAGVFNPGMQFACADIARSCFGDDVFDGVVSYYSIIHTPKRLVHLLFAEFHRILKPNGHLLVAVKAGAQEGYVSKLLGIQTELYFSLFTEREMERYFDQAGFKIEFMEKRNPYDFEIQNERIFAIAMKLSAANLKNREKE